MATLSRKRKGFTLLDVALAAVVLIIGTMGSAKFFNSISNNLSPKGDWGGLRRYLLAEEMLRAEAEGLRVIHDIPTGEGECKFITEPAGMGYGLTVLRSAGPAVAYEQLYYFDITITQAPVGSTGTPPIIGALSVSTVRAIGDQGGLDEKIGL